MDAVAARTSRYGAGAPAHEAGHDTRSRADARPPPRPPDLQTRRRAASHDQARTRDNTHDHRNARTPDHHSRQADRKPSLMKHRIRRRQAAPNPGNDNSHASPGPGRHPYAGHHPQKYQTPTRATHTD